MSAVTVQLDYLRQQIHKNEIVKKYADMIEEKIKFPIEYLICGLSIIPLIMVYYGYFGETISDLVGFIYPVYATVAAIEAKTDLEFWAVYWVVYSFVDILENLFDAILSWIPFYYPLKMLFFVWLFLPQTAGAKIIYKAAVAPVFKSINDSMGS